MTLLHQKMERLLSDIRVVGRLMDAAPRPFQLEFEKRRSFFRDVRDELLLFDGEQALVYLICSEAFP
jgi:hypothetical protein